MYKGKKVIVVMPAYNAEKTLRQTYDEVMAQGVVDEVIVTDDASADATVEVAAMLPQVRVFTHHVNLGYGGNQKTCYREALDEGGDIIIMVHPDYQYTPRLIPAMVSMIGSELYDCVLGSRIRTRRETLLGGMRRYKYIANRVLTIIENVCLGQNLGDFHTGFRAYRREVLETIPFERNSDDFVFDNQILAQILWLDYVIAEISCPTRYFAEASSINFPRSVRYGFGCLGTAVQLFLARRGLWRPARFPDRAARPA